MYNMTRKLQMDLAEDPADREEGDIPDMLYFWKESWMHNEQYSSLYLESIHRQVRLNRSQAAKRNLTATIHSHVRSL